MCDLCTWLTLSVLSLFLSSPSSQPNSLDTFVTELAAAVATCSSVSQSEQVLQAFDFTPLACTFASQGASGSSPALQFTVQLTANTAASLSGWLLRLLEYAQQVHASAIIQQLPAVLSCLSDAIHSVPIVCLGPAFKTLHIMALRSDQCDMLAMHETALAIVSGCSTVLLEELSTPGDVLDAAASLLPPLVDALKAGRVFGAAEVWSVVFPACVAAVERVGPLVATSEWMSESLPPLPEASFGLLVLLRELLIDMGLPALTVQLCRICDTVLWRLGSLLGPRLDAAEDTALSNHYASAQEWHGEARSHAVDGGPLKRSRVSTESDIENQRGENGAVCATGKLSCSAGDMHEVGGGAVAVGVTSSHADLLKRALMLRSLSAMVSPLCFPIVGCFVGTKKALRLEVEPFCCKGFTIQVERPRSQNLPNVRYTEKLGMLNIARSI
jgi:hypothetical protein